MLWAGGSQRTSFVRFAGYCRDRYYGENLPHALSEHVSTLIVLTLCQTILTPLYTVACPLRLSRRVRSSMIRMTIVMVTERLLVVFRDRRPGRDMYWVLTRDDLILT